MKAGRAQTGGNGNHSTKKRGCRTEAPTEPESLYRRDRESALLVSQRRRTRQGAHVRIRGDRRRRHRLARPEPRFDDGPTMTDAVGLGQCCRHKRHPCSYGNLKCQCLYKAELSGSLGARRHIPGVANPCRGAAHMLPTGSPAANTVVAAPCLPAPQRTARHISCVGSGWQTLTLRGMPELCIAGDRWERVTWRSL